MKYTPPSRDKLTKIPFQRAIPDVSWYRHPSWPMDRFERFRHRHTMSQNAVDFEFFNNEDDILELERDGQLDPGYRNP